MAAKNEKKVTPLNIRNIRPMTQNGLAWHVVVPAGTKVEDLLDPLFWTHVAGSTFRGKFNRVTVEWEDKSAIADLYVRHYDQSFATMEVLGHWDFGAATEVSGEVMSKHVVEWSGPHTKHRVKRVEDGQIVAENFSDKKDAIAFAITAEKKMR